MHEFGIAESLLAAVTTAADKAGAAKVLRVRLKIGPLSGVVPEALRFAFDALAAGTVAEGAALEIDEPPVVLYCNDCGREFPGSLGDYRCPHCGSPSGTLRGGRELDVLDMEVA